MQEGRGDGPSGLPWAFVFDPMANARALGEVQRRGLQAAGQLVDRLVSSMEAGPSRPPDTGGSSSSNPSMPGFGALPEVWVEFVSRTLAALTRLPVFDGAGDIIRAVPPSGDVVWVDVMSGRASGSLHLVTQRKGRQAASGAVWLQNLTSNPKGPVRLHAGELQTPEGVILESAAVRFEPEEVEQLPGRSTREVTVSVCWGDAAAVGTYRGVIQAAGAPEVALTVEFVVGHDQD